MSRCKHIRNWKVLTVSQWEKLPLPGQLKIQSGKSKEPHRVEYWTWSKQKPLLVTEEDFYILHLVRMKWISKNYNDWK
jgi:hypothetical protein